jgi:hypothetical protein
MRIFPARITFSTITMIENIRHSTSWLLASIFVLGYCWAYFNINKDQLKRKVPISLRWFGLFATFNVIGLVTAILNGTPPTITQMATTSFLSITTVIIGYCLIYAIKRGKITTPEQQSNNLIERIWHCLAFIETDDTFTIIDSSHRFKHFLSTKPSNKHNVNALPLLFGDEISQAKEKLNMLSSVSHGSVSPIQLETNIMQWKKTKTLVSFSRENAQKGRFLFLFPEI